MGGVFFKKFLTLLLYHFKTSLKQHCKKYSLEWKNYSKYNFKSIW
jgi:hypothetical protein